MEVLQVTDSAIVVRPARAITETCPAGDRKKEVWTLPKEQVVGKRYILP